MRCKCSSLWWRIAVFVAVFVVGVLMIAFYTGQLPAELSSLEGSNISLSLPHRKLLHHEVEPERIWGEKCSSSDIVINQGPTAPLPNGIPTYTVDIINVCSTGCNISGIHVSCKWFSSARLINPKVFKRVAYDDCLVNDGKALANGRTISFAYANTFRYPLSVSNVLC